MGPHDDVQERDVTDDLRARLVLERVDPGLALQVEAVRPIGFCRCLPPALTARDIRACAHCGCRLPAGQPWMRR